MIEIKTDKIRYCGNCFGLLLPTQEYTYQNSHQFWKCPICGMKVLWVADPKLDGSNAELHKLQDGGFSGISMLNDPTCNVFGPPKCIIIDDPGSQENSNIHNWVDETILSRQEPINIDAGGNADWVKHSRRTIPPMPEDGFYRWHSRQQIWIKVGEK